MFTVSQLLFTFAYKAKRIGIAGFFLFCRTFPEYRGIPSKKVIQWNLSKADTYGTEVFVSFRQVSALERFELKSSKI